MKEIITFKFLELNGYESVTDYCRDLVKNGDNWPDMTIEVYRDDMLCLTVTDVERAATVMPRNNRWVKYNKNRRAKVDNSPVR